MINHPSYRAPGRAWLSTALLWAGLAGALPSAGLAAQGRVIVLGFDGADARTAQTLMDQGALPNLKRLSESGTFGPLTTTNPAESPVSWAALNCGQNPAKTGVPGFIRRELPGSQGPSRLPSPNFGHLIGPVDVPIEQFRGTPIPTWSAMSLGGALGASVLVAFLIVFILLLRLKPMVGFTLALVLGGIGFWGGLTLRRYLPAQVPKFKNPLEVAPFWETAAKSGVQCVVLDAAQSFDREDVPNARVLAGLGVPDARGSVNSFFIYTTDELAFKRAPEGEDTDSGGVKYRVDERDGKIESLVCGPVNFWELDQLKSELRRVKEELDTVGYKRSLELQDEKKALEDRIGAARRKRATVPLRVEKKGELAAVTIGRQTQELAEGQWSDFFRMTFELNPVLKVKAITRVKILHLSSPHFELYVDALEIDPASPPFWQPISQPADYASQLAHATGPFETVGWACMNLPFKDSVIDAQSFMEDIEFTMGWRERLTYDALARGDWRILMTCESTPDRVQHMMYQYYDAQHPLYDATAAAHRMKFCGEEIALSDAIPASYRQMDRIVGKVLDLHVKAGDTLIVCSDHGFQSFRRQVHLNNWLIEKGYLAIRADATKDSTSMLDSYVDWSRTRAYAVGLGMLYVNMRGREGQGIVEPAEARALLDQIRSDFLASTDVKTGERFGHDAYVLSEIHKDGAFQDREADMLLCFKPGYRVSWDTTLGGFRPATGPSGELIAAEACSDNTKNWSGDHVTVDPSFVAGVFASNRKVKVPEGGFNLLHIAPTALALVGVPVPKEYDLPPLEFE